MRFLGAQGPVSTAHAAERRDRRQVEITSELRLTVERGFRYLLRQQTAAGDFDDEFPVAINALAGIAFLSGGYTERLGPPRYTEALRRTTEAILRRQTDAGYFDDGESRMYGHGFATLFLAELYGTRGTEEEKRLETALRKAVRLIEMSQGRDGGWDYCPLEDCDGKSGGSDTSITVCQTMALRAARNLGIVVDAGVVRRAGKFVARAQNSDGGFRYRMENDLPYMFRTSLFPRSAAGVCIMYSLGDYNSSAVRRGFDYLEQEYRKSTYFPYYAHYYCAQAMLQAGGRRWREYFAFVRQQLISEQTREGGWRSHGTNRERENDNQATAMALIVLQLPYRFLPILER